MEVTDLFGTTECSRCGGSGRYSFNQMHGDMCYGCNGKGIKLTKAGAAARDAWVAAFTVTVKVQDVQPGMKVMVTDYMRGREVCKTVTKSEADPLNVGQNRWNLQFQVSNPNSSELGGWGSFFDTDIRLPASADDKRAAYDAISDMPGALGWPEQPLDTARGSTNLQDMDTATTHTVLVTAFGDTREVECHSAYTANDISVRSVGRVMVGKFPTGTKLHPTTITLYKRIQVRNGNTYTSRGPTAAVINGEEYVLDGTLYTHNRNVGRIIGWMEQDTPEAIVAQWDRPKKYDPQDAVASKVDDAKAERDSRRKLADMTPDELMGRMAVQGFRKNPDWCLGLQTVKNARAQIRRITDLDNQGIEDWGRSGLTYDQYTATLADNQGDTPATSKEDDMTGTTISTGNAQLDAALGTFDIASAKSYSRILINGKTVGYLTSKRVNVPTKDGYKSFLLGTKAQISKAVTAMKRAAK